MLLRNRALVPARGAMGGVITRRRLAALEDVVKAQTQLAEALLERERAIARLQHAQDYIEEERALESARFAVARQELRVQRNAQMVQAAEAEVRLLELEAKKREVLEQMNGAKGPPRDEPPRSLADTLVIEFQPEE